MTTPLAGCAGFVFDLDGCVWNGTELEPGAREAIAALHAGKRGVAFLTNNSRAMGAEVRARLHAHGITAAEHVLTPLEIIGGEIARRFGPSRVLVMGAAELAAAVGRDGHEVVDMARYREATVVVVGNDFDVDFDRLTAAARAAAAGAPLVTPNLDPRLPIEGGDFLPGCGAFVEAVATAAGVRPVVIGKPHLPLFRMALERLGVEAARAAMVGDTPASDMRGGRAAGMRTVLYAPRGHPGPLDADTDHVVESFGALRELAGL